MRMSVQSLASLCGLRIRGCHKLRCRSHSWLGSWVAVAVAVAGSCSSYSIPSLGTSTCHRCNPKKQNKTKQNKTKNKNFCLELHYLWNLPVQITNSNKNHSVQTANTLVLVHIFSYCTCIGYLEII